MSAIKSLTGKLVLSLLSTATGINYKNALPPGSVITTYYPLAEDLMDRVSLADMTNTGTAVTHTGTSTLIPSGADLQAPTYAMNGYTYSELLTDSDWTKSQLSITPEGIAIPSTANNIHYFEQRIPVVSGETYTQHIRAEAGGYSFIQILGNASFGFSSTDFINIDLTDGTVGNSLGSTFSAVIENVGGNVYDIWVTATAIGTAADALFFNCIYNTDVATRAPTYAGDGSSGVDIKRIMWTDLPIKSAYLKTEGSAKIYEKGNQFPYSEDLASGRNYVKTGIVQDDTTAPDGTLTADLVRPTAGAGANYWQQNTDVISGLDYTQSLYGKASGYEWVQFACSSGFTASHYININVTTGEVGNSAGTWTTEIGATDSYGFRRIAVTITATASTPTGRIVVSVLGSDIAGRLLSQSLDGVSGVYQWGCQLKDSTIPSNDYVKTDAATSFLPYYSWPVNDCWYYFNFPNGISNVGGTQYLAESYDPDSSNRFIIQHLSATPSIKIINIVAGVQYDVLMAAAYDTPLDVLFKIDSSGGMSGEVSTGATDTNASVLDLKIGSTMQIGNNTVLNTPFVGYLGGVKNGTGTDITLEQARIAIP